MSNWCLTKNYVSQIDAKDKLGALSGPSYVAVIAGLEVVVWWSGGDPLHQAAEWKGSLGRGIGCGGGGNG